MQTHDERHWLMIGALVAVAVYWVGLIFFFGLMPYPPSLTGLSDGSESTLEHAVTHMVLGVLVYLLLRSVSQNTRRNIAFAFLAAVMLGGSLEIAQIFVDRDTELMDLVADGAGAAVGIVAVAALMGSGLKYELALVIATAMTLVAGVVVTASAAVAIAARPDEITCDLDAMASAPDAPHVTPRPLPASGRQTDGLIALYDFSAGSGDVVRDISGVAPALDLRILDTSQVTWLSGSNGVEFAETGSVIRSDGAAKKVYDALTASNQLTVEVWASTDDPGILGPARIVSISDGDGPFNVNFHIGQIGDGFSQRLRTHCEVFNWGGAHGAITKTDTLYQLVTTYDGLNERAYVDGSLFRTELTGGDLSNWDPDYPLLVGNEESLDHGFPGRVYLVAIYDRALSDEEIARNFEVGPGPVGAGG